MKNQKFQLLHYGFIINQHMGRGALPGAPKMSFAPKKTTLQSVKEALAKNFNKLHTAQVQKALSQVIKKLKITDRDKLLPPIALKTLGAKSVSAASRMLQKGQCTQNEIRSWMSSIGVGPGTISLKPKSPYVSVKKP